jgi:hypothetical protein
MKRKTIRKADGSKYKKTRRRNHGINNLISDIRIIIESENNGGTCDLNSNQVMLFWQIGKKIGDELNKIKESRRREKTLADLSSELRSEFGQCFSKKSLVDMTRFCKSFSDSRTASLLANHLEWRHFKTLITIRNPLKRNFYAELARMNAWSPEELKEEISDMLFERTSIKGGKQNSAEKRLFEALRGESKSLSDFIYDDHDGVDL